MIHLDAGAQRLTKAREPGGDQHELLDIDTVGGVGAPIQDVETRDGKDTSGCTAEIAVQRHPDSGGRGPGCGQRDREDGVGAEMTLVRGSVEIEHHLVDGFLVRRIHADDGIGDRLVDIGDGSQHALPP